MAGDIPNLNVEVLVQLTNLTTAVNEAVAGMTKISNVAKESSEKASSSFTKLKDVMLGVFGGNLLTSGVMGLEKTLSEMNLAVQDAQVETLRLDTALKNSGNTSVTVSTQVDKTVKSYAELGFTHAQASKAMGTLVTATGNVSESTKLMAMAADLARYKHEDLNTAATVLARGTQGAVRAFKELGITLDSHLPKNEAIAKAFDQLNQKIGGQAVSYTHTFAGEMAVLKEKFNEAAVTIGNVLFPIVGKLIQIFMDVMKVIGNVVALLKPFIDFIKANAAAFEVLVGVIGTAVAIWKTYELAVKAAQIAEEGLAIATAALGNPFAIITIAIAALAAGFVALWNHSETFRKAVTAGIKIVVEAFGYFVGAIGKVIEAATHLPFIGGHFKGIASAVNEAAVSIGKFSQGLDGLANKKISLPSFLGGANSGAAGSTGSDMGVSGNVPGGNVDTAANKAAKAAAAHLAKVKSQLDALVKLEADAAEKSFTITRDHLQKVEVIQRDHDQRLQQMARDHDIAIAKLDTSLKEQQNSILDSYNTKKFDAEKAAADKLLTLETDTANKIADAQKAGAEQQQAIVQQSIDLMRNAFAGVTGYDIGSNFADGIKGGFVVGTGDLIKQMQDHLASIQKLQDDAGKLAGLGYTQTFIDQVVAQGPKIGDQLAQALIKASPETTGSIQDLYANIQDTSAHGLDKLATDMNKGGQLATEQLTASYTKAGADLKAQLDLITSDSQAAQAQIQDDLNTTLVTLAQDRDKAMADALASYHTQLADLNTSYTNALADANQSLANSLADANTQFNNQMNDLLASTLKSLAAISQALTSLGVKGAASGGATYTPSTTPNYGNYGGLGGSTGFGVTYGPGIGASSPAAGLTINQTNNITTPTAPADMLSATVSGVLYGQALSLPSTPKPLPVSTQR